MSSANEVQVVSVEELGDHVGSKCETHSPVVLSPALDILVRVRPEQITEQSGVGDICWSHDPPDLLHALQVRTEAAVATEDLLIHDGGNWQTVETIRECLPQLDVVPPFA